MTDPASPVKDSTVPIDEPTSAEPEVSGIFGGRYLWVSIGMCTLIMLSAFESLAMTTVMPTISAELNGAALYALAFAGPLAVGVVGMVAAASWSDRRGPQGALYASVVLFIVGLLVVGTAFDMGILVIGRLIQGLGGGALTVALYVIVARVYPAVLHPRIFAAFAAAWVIPSLVGPFVAGVVTEQFGWRWVFLGVVALVVLAMAMVIPVMRNLRSGRGEASQAGSIARLGWAALVAVAVLAVNLAADATGVLLWLVPVVAGVVALIALRPLFPVGTLRAGRGLPGVVLIRGLIAGSFFGAEVYVPYLLTDQYGFPASAAGLALTGAGLTWAGTSWLQGRLVGRMSHTLSIVLGTLMVLVAVAAAFLTAVLHLSPGVMIAAWALAGAGNGIMYPRMSVMALEYSTLRNQGFNSAALTIADSIGASIALAVTAIAFSVLTPLGGAWPFAGSFAVTVILTVIALALSGRTVRRHN